MKPQTSAGARVQAALDYLRVDRDSLYESHFDPKLDGLSPEDAAMIAEVDEIIQGLASVLQELQRPDSLSQALNESGGVYRP